MNELELLKCPCCGDLPEVRKWGLGCYVVSCTRYACNLPQCIIATDKTSAIKEWNKMVNKYEGAHNEQTHPKEKDNPET